MKLRSRRFAAALVFLCLALFALARWVIVPYRICGSSMLPTLVGAEPGGGATAPGTGPGGDIVLVNRCAYLSSGPSRWDVAILRHETGAESVKRVAGLPGETVEIREGRLIVDDAPLDPPPQLAGQYIVQKGRFGYAPVKLGDGEYFLLGDASYLSSDSRRWGPVKREDIEGRVVAVLLPWSRRGWVR